MGGVAAYQNETRSRPVSFENASMAIVCRTGVIVNFAYVDGLTTSTMMTVGAVQIASGPEARPGSEANRNRRALWRAHSRPDLRAQRVDRDQAFGGLQVPEGPAVAGFEPLGQRADAVDRADRVAQRDGAVGAHQRLDLALGVA